jgi:outer membrane protein assembly factor BamB
VPSGTWRVTVEFSRLLGRPSGIVADATGIYLAGAVLSNEDVRMRRWAIVKLDPKGKVAWSSASELPREPAPDRIVLADGALIAGGQDDTHEAARLLMIERRDLKSGKPVWQRRFTARDPKCTTAGCGGKDTFGGLAVRGSSVIYYATVDRPIEAAMGELGLAKGDPAKTAYPMRSDMRAHDVAADDTGVYALDDTLSGAFSLVKRAEGKLAWQQKVESSASRVVTGAGGLVLWGNAIEKRATDTGELVWTSPLTGEHIDVAVDGSAIFATVMIDAKPAPYFAIAKLDAGTGAVQWVRKTSEYSENRPSAYIAVDAGSIYVFGYDGEKWFVEKRRKSDGALGDVTTVAAVVESKRK